jgi:catechol 2,3-dioxygenase-like lactoylglutathione lyase family enzyme
MVHFYGAVLRFPVVTAWDRANGRGRRFDLGGGLRLEILDNTRERKPAALFIPEGRTHIVIEVADIEAAWRSLPWHVAPPQNTSWGARLFKIYDPDGIALTYLEWTHDVCPPTQGSERLSSI